MTKVNFEFSIINDDCGMGALKTMDVISTIDALLKSDHAFPPLERFRLNVQRFGDDHGLVIFISDDGIFAYEHSVERPEWVFANYVNGNVRRFDKATGNTLAALDGLMAVPPTVMVSLEAARVGRAEP